MKRHCGLQRVATQFKRSLAHYNQQATVQAQMAQHLAQMLESHLPDNAPEKLLEIGCGTGLFTRELLRRYPLAHYALNDLNAEVLPHLLPLLAQINYRFLPGDAQRIPLPAAIDLIAANAAVQWFDDLPAFLRRAQRSLKDGGCLAFSTFAPGTLHEIRHLSGRGLAFLCHDAIVQLAQPQWHVLGSAQQRVVQRYPSALAVLRHLKHTGVNGVGNTVWTPGQLNAFCRHYAQQFSGADDTVTLTWHPLYFVLQKRS